MRFLFTTLPVTALLLFVWVPVVYAQTSPDLSVSPVVIDEKGKQRDILKENIMLKNNTSRVLELYPSVRNINIQDGTQTFSLPAGSQDLDDSLANWIELTRGVIQLSPGETRSIPFIIRINMNAIAGQYHAQISFTDGNTRAEADSKPPLGTVTVNLEVQADITELLQLQKFSTDNVFFSGDDVLFDYQLQNIGNQELQPKGQIHIYDRRGREVATVDVNKTGKTIAPSQDSQLASVWSAAQGFGRYKAMIDVAYGSTQTASVQDTVFFWVIPWKQVLIVFFISLVCVVVLALYFHRYLENRHLYKFAHAGLLNDDTLRKMHADEILPHPLVPPAHVASSQAKFKEEKAREKPMRLREMLHKKEAATHGHAINLKNLHTKKEETASQVGHVVHIPKAPQQQHAEGHIISLKKKNDA